MGQFSDSINKTIQKISLEINDKIVLAATDLFSGVVADTPVATGLLINNWFSAIGSYSSSTTATTDKSGESSYTNISAIGASEPFYNKDSMVSLSNNLDYAYQAEALGWVRTGPYRMVEINLINAANKVYK